MHRFKPSASRRVLLALAGGMWLGVGLMLLRLAWIWLGPETRTVTWELGVAGAVAALLIHHLGFLRIVDRNLGRIRAAPDRPCVFSFMPLRSYGMVAVMMGMGIALRHSPIPHAWLAPFYVAMGGALVLSSVRYIRVLVTSWKSL
ncbi:MAG: hypothetical protein ABIJ09_04270 [Pseudomonadota bacterium]